MKKIFMYFKNNHVATSIGIVTLGFLCISLFLVLFYAEQLKWRSIEINENIEIDTRKVEVSVDKKYGIRWYTFDMSKKLFKDKNYMLLLKSKDTGEFFTTKSQYHKKNEFLGFKYVKTAFKDKEYDLFFLQEIKGVERLVNLNKTITIGGEIIDKK